MYRHFFKRLFDFLAALIGLVLLSPVLLVATIGLYFANDGKPFFFQMRPGKDSRIFRIIKFKTMNDAKNPDGTLKPDAERLTSAGAFVRKTSIDEIPQLINVLKGDMSLIGPRPLLVSYLDHYNDAEMLRQTVRPGITGLAQVKGRNNISWYDKMKYDIEYVENLSFLMDVRIFFMTIGKVVKSEGIAKDGHATSDTFDEFCAEHPIRHYKK